MYITENQSLGESVLFMLSARSSLAEMVEDSGHEDSGEMINFLMNEASDYEIISLVVEGVIPDEKYNDVHEALLFSDLKEQVLANYEMVSEMVGQKTFSDFMNKVDSVYPEVSTAGPMLEFFSGQFPEVAGASLLSELPSWMGKLGIYTKKSAEAAAKKAQGDRAAMKSDVSALKGAGARSMKQQADVSQKADVDAMKGAAARSMKQQQGAETSTMATVKQGVEQGVASVKAGIDSAAGAVSKFAKQPEGMAVGAAALAALLAYGAAKTYKRFFSKAAGACRGQSGSAKTACMNKFRGRALMAQAADLQRGMAACAKAKNPTACKASVSGKIERLKAKARKISG